MNPKSKLYLALFANGLLLVTASLNAQEPQQLRWKFNQGDSFDVQLTQTSQIESTVDSRTRKIDNRIVLKMNWSVEQVSEAGGGTIEQSIRAIKIVTNSAAGGGVNIDTENVESKKGVDAQLMKQILALVDARFSVEVSPQGELTSVVVPEETKEKLRQLPGSMQIRQLLTDEGIRKLYGQSAIVLPASAVAKGHSWERQAKVESPLGIFPRTDRYEFTQLDPADATILVTTTLGKQTEGSKSETSLTGYSGNGQIIFDVDDGYVRECWFENEMRTERPYREKTIETTVDSRVELTFKVVSEAEGE